MSFIDKLFKNNSSKIHRLGSIKMKAAPYFFIAPSITILLIFSILPIFSSVRLAMINYNVVNPDMSEFIGLDNFKELLTKDPYIWQAVWVTAKYSVGTVIIGLFISLLISLAITESWFKFGNIIRIIYFLPFVLSITIAGLVFSWIYHPSFGLLNYALSFLGIPDHAWLGDPKLALMSVIMMVVWKGLGYNVTIWSAGLLSLPVSLREAARIDGANWFKELIYIRLPQLKPVALFLTVLGIIGSFQSFDAIYVMTSGGPVRTTQVMVYYLYKSAFRDMRLGYGSAIAWLLFVLIMGLTFIQFRLYGKEEA